MSMAGIASAKHVFIDHEQLWNTSPHEEVQRRKNYLWMNAQPKLFDWSQNHFKNLKLSHPLNNGDKYPLKEVPHLLRQILTNPKLVSCVWEETVRMHEGMNVGEKLRDKSAMLLISMSSMLLHNNLVLTDDQSF
jgi:hypothetical protein